MIVKCAEETKDEYERAMGHELGRVFYALMADVHYLHMKWGDYTALFDKRTRVELLNEVAPAYFARLQDIYVHDTFLHISRLTDTAKSGKHNHLTVRRLVSLVERPGLRTELKKLVAEMDAKAAFCRAWRNRTIAHTEYELALGQATEPLPPTTRAMTGQLISVIAAILKAVCRDYCDSDLHFPHESRPRYRRAGAASLHGRRIEGGAATRAPDCDARLSARGFGNNGPVNTRIKRAP